ncbi:MAG: hypothetical protein OEY20_03410 [Gemmatimonadota bacterium]|nr:hypothetical protein [Gemmatimonadota bacterium]MDH4351520.1 hypothetical protein [Gemmatimonadota bacterium]MDH5196284.1 hypothetical protein [Gemmatimonadota bacterium]
MLRHVTTFMTLVLLLGVADAAAQQQERRRDGTGPMHQMQEAMPGMAMSAFSPTHLLQMREELVLTEAQVTQLEQIQTTAESAHDQAMASHDKHRDEMMKAIEAEQPNADVVRAHFTGAHDSMGVAHWAEMEAGLKAMAVLTDAQRTKIKDMRPPAGGMQHREGQGMHHPDQHHPPASMRR